MKSHQLREYCDAEFENIDAVVTELFAVVKTNQSKYSNADLAAIATFVHNFYNGIENILKRVLSLKQREMKNTPTWHKDLLKISLNEGIITNNLYATLLNYLAFRHFFIHSYSFALKWEELRPLVDSLDDTLKKFKSSVYDYIDILS